jgi:hypothetical protein
LKVPALCDSCGNIFLSDIEVNNSIHISFSGCTSGPCPKCGGVGHIPDGLYNFIGNTIELLSGPARTVSELQRLEIILSQARDEGIPIEQVSKRIQDEVPELSSLKDFLPKSRSELYAFLTIIITIISLILGQLKQSQSPKIEINQVINLICQPQNPSILGAPKSRIKHKATVKVKKKVGRNAPCPCGSGKKYKNAVLIRDEDLLGFPSATWERGGGELECAVGKALLY